MINALIVEDEPLARDELKYLLKRTQLVHIIEECDSIDLALEYLGKIESIDVVFLDIQLGEQNGMQLAEKIQKMKNPPEIVFATAYDCYALHAFDMQAIDYLLKPFDEERIQVTIKKLEKTIANKHATHSNQENKIEKLEKIAVTIDDKMKIIAVEDIQFISSQNGKTMIATEIGVYTVTSTLIQLEQKLKVDYFLRVHRSFLVNTNKIVEIEPWFHSTYQLKMKNGDKVPVSRNYTKNLKLVFGF